MMGGLLSYIIFGIGGGAGAGLRHAMSKCITHRFPLSTLIVNVLGSFILGVGTGLLLQSTGVITDAHYRLVFGFCGGFTTFSSFAYQSLDLHRTETMGHAAMNIGLSLVLCVAAYAVGMIVV